MVYITENCIRKFSIICEYKKDFFNVSKVWINYRYQVKTLKHDEHEKGQHGLISLNYVKKFKLVTYERNTGLKKKKICLTDQNN